MDWILTQSQMPTNKSKVWVLTAFGDACLVKVKLVKERRYFHGTLENGDIIKRCTKWATYDVIY